MAEDTTEAVAGRQVADPEEFNQTERLRSINEVRKQAGEAIQTTMTQLRTEPSFEEADRQQILRAAIYRYLTEIEWLAHQAESEELLHSKTLGHVTLDPPEWIQNVVNEDRDDFPRPIGEQSLETKQWTIEGINDYLTAPDVFSASWTIHAETRHGGPQTISDTQATYMPAHVSLNAYRVANKFLSDQGIDVELADEQHRAVVDNEVLEEVESWRKQNVE